MKILSALIGTAGVALWVYFKFDIIQLLLILLLMWGNNITLLPNRNQQEKK